ncbi:MAG: EVE domain-containing protein [Polyangiaceae bacterium]|nr:EVE domain-containing protein [Polyangiaceae bacterium]
MPTLIDKRIARALDSVTSPTKKNARTRPSRRARTRKSDRTVVLWSAPVPKAPAQHWLIKSEPSKYSWAQLEKDGRTYWDGVRNFEARNFLRAMKVGDFCLFYHSNEGKELVGLAKVVKEAYPDPTSPEEDWSAVDVAPIKPLKAPVSLEAIKSDPDLTDMALLKRSRLSVVPVTKPQFDHILKLARTKV